MKHALIPSVNHVVTFVFATKFQAQKVQKIIERNIDENGICYFLSLTTPIFTLVGDDNTVTFGSGVYGTFIDPTYQTYKFTGEGPLVTVERGKDCKGGDNNFVSVWQCDNDDDVETMGEVNQYLEFEHSFAEHYPEVIFDIYERFLDAAKFYAMFPQTKTSTD